MGAGAGAENRLGSGLSLRPVRTVNEAAGGHVGRDEPSWRGFCQLSRAD